MRDFMEPLINILITFLQYLDQMTSSSIVLWCEKRYRGSLLICSSSPPDSVHIVFNILWEIVIDNYSDILNIDSSACYISCYQHWDASILEFLHNFISPSLRFVSVDCIDRPILISAFLFDPIRSFLGV